MSFFSPFLGRARISFGLPLWRSLRSSADSSVFEPDALRHTLQVNPHLPAEWDKLSAEQVQVGGDAYNLTMNRDRELLQIEATSKTPTVMCLARTRPDSDCKALAATVHRLSIPLPAR